MLVPMGAQPNTYDIYQHMINVRAGVWVVLTLPLDASHLHFKSVDFYSL